MQQAGLSARHRRQRMPFDTGWRNAETIAADILDRQFQADQPNRRSGS